MACACKSNGNKKQVTQITKRTPNTSVNTRKSVNSQERKQIIIRRPVR